MKLSVSEYWSDEGADYFIEDLETGTPDVVDITFDTKAAAQAYLDAHRDDIERKGLPPLTPEEFATYWQIFETIEKKLDAGDLQVEKHLVMVKYLLRLARQPEPLEQSSLLRLESVISRLNLLAEMAAAANARVPLDAREAEMNLDQARACMEMQDRNEALCYLDEVIRRGDGAYKDRARKMIDEISAEIKGQAESKGSAESELPGRI